MQRLTQIMTAVKGIWAGMGIRNENGEIFRSRTGRITTSPHTVFIHGEHNKDTRHSPDGVTKNQIDHNAISIKQSSSFLDVRNRHGVDIDSDPRPVVAAVLLKAVAQPTKATITMLAKPSYYIAYSIAYSRALPPKIQA